MNIYSVFPELKKFIKNIDSAGNNIPALRDNIYVIKCEDENGNVTDVKYGLNIITDAGLASNGLYAYSDSYLSLALCEGTFSTPTYTDCAVPTVDRKVSATFTLSNQVFDMQYDSVSGYIYQNRQMGYFVFDYNYSGIDSNMTISMMYLYPNNSADNNQYNIPTNTVISKVLIYDQQGQPSSFIKHTNERVTVYFIHTGSMNESIINEAWSNGFYILASPGVMTNPFRIRSTTETMTDLWSGPLFTYFGIRDQKYEMCDSTATNRSTSYTYSYGSADYRRGIDGPFSNNTSYCYGIHDPNFIIKDPRIYISRCSMASVNGTSANQGFYVFTYEKLPSSEEITCENVYTNSTDSPLITKTFGGAFDPNSSYGVIPAIDFNITSVYGYNYYTKAWDIQIPYKNPTIANQFYDDSLFNKYGDYNVQDYDAYKSRMFSIQIDGNTRYILVNTRLNNAKIVSFTTDRTVNVYATDKYWDSSTYVKITDLSNVPQALQRKKYYILDNPSQLIPTYDYDAGEPHELNVGTKSTVTGAPAAADYTSLTNDKMFAYRMIAKETSNDGDGWILGKEHLMFMSGKTVTSFYKLEAEISDGTLTTIDPMCIRYSFGTKIAVAARVTSTANNFPYSIRIYDVSTPDTQPTYTDVVIDVDTATQTASRNSPVGASYSSNGYVVIQHNGTYVANIIDVNAGTKVKILNTKNAMALDFSNHCIYQEPELVGNSVVRFHVYDMSTDTEEATFDLNGIYSDIRYICGWRNHFYIKSYYNNNYVVHMYDVLTGSLNQIENLSIQGEFNTANPGTVRRTIYDIQLHHYDFMITSVSGTETDASLNPTVIKYDNPTESFGLWKSGGIAERSIEELYEYNSYQGRRFSIATDINVSYDETKLLLINYRAPTFYYVTTEWGSYQRKLCADIGPGIDGAKPVSACYKHAPLQDSTYYGGAVYWYGGIISVDGVTGETIWTPLEWFINSKVTGTTRTIQAYNNPKKIRGTKYFEWSITNRVPEDNPTYTTPSKMSGFYWSKHSIVIKASSPDSDWIYYGKRFDTLITGPRAVEKTITSGSAVTVEVTPTSGYSALDGTFEWNFFGVKASDKRLYDFTSGWKTCGSSNSYTLPNNAEIAYIAVRTNSSDVATLSINMIDDIIVKVDGTKLT